MPRREAVSAVSFVVLTSFIVSKVLLFGCVPYLKCFSSVSWRIPHYVGDMRAIDDSNIDRWKGREEEFINKRQLNSVFTIRRSKSLLQMNELLFTFYI
jgi:hypothetical protein